MICKSVNESRLEAAFRARREMLRHFCDHLKHYFQDNHDHPQSSRGDDYIGENTPERREELRYTRKQQALLSITTPNGGTTVYCALIAEKTMNTNKRSASEGTCLGCWICPMKAKKKLYNTAMSYAAPYARLPTAASNTSGLASVSPCVWGGGEG